MPTISQVLETSLYVEDLERSERFYHEVLGLKTMVGDDRLRALAVADRQVLLLFLKGASTQPSVLPGGTILPHDGSGNLHLAFAIAASELPAWEQTLSYHRVVVESRVDWPRGGQSIYFHDPDGHLIELVTPGCWPIY